MSAVTPFNTSNITLFQPNQIAGLALWLDAADTSTMSFSGANVTQWRDKSGNLNHATGPANGITLDSANNRLVFPPTGSPYLSNTTMAYPLSTRTIFIVAEETTSANYSGVLSFIPNPNSGLDYTTTNGMSIETTNGMRFYQSNAAYLSDLSTTTPTNPFPKAIYCDRLQTTTGSGFVNGTNKTNVTASFTPGTSIGFVVGTRWTIGSGGYFKGYMYEILAFNVSLSTTQRQQIESYLAYKWGLQSSLPSSHPYYASPYNAYPPFTNINQITKFVYPVLPSDIGGLALWLDAADGATLFQNTAGTTPVTNGSQIQLWKDKSSSVNNATNSQTVMTYNSSGLNGLPAISFPGTQTTGFSLSGALLPNGSSDATYFFVLNKNNGSTQVFFTHGGATQMKQFYAGFGLYIDRAGVGLINDSTTITNLNTIVSSSETSLTNGVNGWRNGNSFTTNGATTTWNVNTTTAWLGSGETSGTPAFIYAGVISEVIVYRTALSTTNRQAVEGYLAYKWNLQVNLPTSHPYYRNLFLPNVALSAPTSIGNYQYSPRAISGLALWLDAADSASVVTSGSSVTAWNDKSGNGYTITAASGSQPTYTSNTISFNGSQFFTTNYTNFPAAESIFMIVNVSVPSGEGTFLQPNQSQGRQFYVDFSNLQTARYGVAVLLSSTMIYNLRTLVESTNSGASLNHFINGLNVGSVSVTPYIGTGSTTTIGARSIGDRGITGSIHEIVIFNSVLTTTQRQQIEGYLAWKWGLQKSLPSNHPFYLIPQG